MLAKTLKIFTTDNNLIMSTLFSPETNRRINSRQIASLFASFLYEEGAAGAHILCKRFAHSFIYFFHTFKTNFCCRFNLPILSLSLSPSASFSLLLFDFVASKYFLVGFRICRGCITPGFGLAAVAYGMSESPIPLLNKQFHIISTVYIVHGMYMKEQSSPIYRSLYG